MGGGSRLKVLFKTVEVLMASHEEEASSFMRSIYEASRPASLLENQGKRQIRKAVLGLEQTSNPGLENYFLKWAGMKLDQVLEQLMSQATVNKATSLP